MCDGQLIRDRQLYKNWLRALVWTLVTVSLTGCVKDEFKVSFEVGADINRTYTLLYYASDSKKGWVMESVVGLQKGAGEVLGKTVNPCLVYLFETGVRLPQAIFYVERGDKILISGKGGDPAGWSVTGNKLTEELTEWRLANRSVIEAARKPGGDGVSKLNAAVGRYVAGNPESPVSTLLMLLYFDRRADEALFRKTWSMLKGDATETKWRELVSRSDMYGDVPVGDKMPGRIVLNTIATGCDTIIPGHVPTLLYFTKNSVGTYDQDMDTLRRLTRDFGDSTRRVIAEISFEPDSLARWYSARGDSIRNVVRGWLPLGVSDQQAVAMGVSRVPYVIVLGRNGSVVYRGDDIKTAAWKFRSVMK